MMSWKGWVESRIRLLTLKIEKDINGVLQCHPNPGEFSDKSKPFHRSYFMGLRRKKGAKPQEGEQFNLCWTIEGFKHDVKAYSLWKRTMSISVLHVKRKDIPTFVFPGGVRPLPRARRGADIMSRRKRKQEEVSRGASPTESSSTIMCISDTTSLVDETRGKKRAKPDFGGTTNDVCPEIPGLSSLALEKPVNGELPTGVVIYKQESLVVVDDELFKSETPHIGGQIEGIKLLPDLSPEQGVGVAGGDSPMCSTVHPKVDLEELEPLELYVPSATACLSANVPAQKPLIRFSFTSFPQTTCNSALRELSKSCGSKVPSYICVIIQAKFN